MTGGDPGAPESRPAARIVTLGCPKNEADSEAFAACLAAAGYRLVGDPAAADLLLLNTCAFIAPAVEESLDALQEALEWKREAEGRRLILAGCLPGRFPDDGSGGLEEIDLVTGPAGTDRLMAFLSVSAGGPPRQVEPGVHRYLRLSEGCSNGCAYCTIPLIRGPHAPRPLDDILRDAEAMVRGGVSEIGLVAQDTGSWRSGRSDVAALLAELARRHPGIWLRLYYLHPAHFPDGLLDVMESEPRVAPYLELPIQHASDSVLSRMGRPYGLRNLEDLFGRFERSRRRLAVRTTVIAGYPGETPEDLRTLTGFLRDHPCIRTLCAFPYWPEEGTAEYARPGGGTAPDPALVQSALAALGEVSDALLDGWAEALEGEEIDVLVDSPEQGHSPYDAPVVDGACLLPGGQTPGTFLRCRVEECIGPDLVVAPLGGRPGIGGGCAPCLSSLDRHGPSGTPREAREVNGRSFGELHPGAPGQPSKNEPR